MLYLILLIGLTVDIARCNLYVSPQNTAVIAGQMMAIECRTQNGSVVREWTLLRASPGENHKLQQHLNNGKIFSNWNSATKPTHSVEFSIDVDQYGSGTLYSNSTTLENAGLYSCVIEFGHELTRSSAEVIVFESTPVCDTNLNTSTGNSMIEGNRIWMRCSIRFRGYWTPSMEWRQHDGEDKDGQIIAADEVVKTENFNVASMINIIFNSSINNSFFSCKTYFATQKHRRLANATNAPDFNYLWKSPVIKQTSSTYAVVNSTPLTTTSLDTGFNSSTNLYVVSLIAIGTLAALSCIVTTTVCIRMKRTPSDAVTIPAKAVDIDRPISSCQTAVHMSSTSLYETIDDERTMPVPTVQDTAYLCALNQGSRTSSTISIHGGWKNDCASLCTIQQIDKRYENAEICASNKQSQAVLTLPNPDAESPSPGGNYPADLNGDRLQDTSACEDVSYVKVVAQVREPAPYESLQPSSTKLSPD